jgi:hypothetical protein
MRRCTPILMTTLAAAISAPAALAAEGPAAAPPMTNISLMAWLGSWASLQSPSVAPPAGDGQAAGDLAKAFHVAWQRTGGALHVKVTRLADAWVGRLAIEFRFGPQTRALTYAYADCPVRLPLTDAKPGPLVWAWDYGVPAWLMGESETNSAAVILDATTTHGFFADKAQDGTIVVACSLDWPKAVGESVEAGFHLAAGTSAAALQTERRQRLGIPPDPALDLAKLNRLRAAGLVQVDKAGWGFVTADGQPLRILGQNRSHLAMLSPAEQEPILAQYEAGGLTVTRLLLPDYVYRPMGRYNDEAYGRLMATIDRCAAHGIHVVICLEYSACADQYNVSVHATRNWSDLYTMPGMLDFYRGTVARVVPPLRDNPAVLGYDVTNEPDIALSPATPTLSGGWHDWLRARYGDIARLRDAWGKPDLVSFDSAEVPTQRDYDGQTTRPARDFFAFGGGAIGQGLIARAKIVRAADPHHLITISGWDPRLLRGQRGADVFDYWSPHSYEIYFVGREISDQVMYQLGILRRALPDRPRPVVIEEFGLVENDPRYPEAMKAAHARAFLDAGDRWGVGIMIWSDLTSPLVAEFAAASKRAPSARTDGSSLAFYLPPSAEWHVPIYSAYMWRRKWGEALASAQEAGFRVREVVKPSDAAGCKALLILSDSLTPAEAQTVRGFGLPVLLTPGAHDAAQVFPEAPVLPADWAAKVALWQGLGSLRNPGGK